MLAAEDSDPGLASARLKPRREKAPAIIYFGGRASGIGNTSSSGSREGPGAANLTLPKCVPFAGAKYVWEEQGTADCWNARKGEKTPPSSTSAQGGGRLGTGPGYGTFPPPSSRSTSKFDGAERFPSSGSSFREGRPLESGTSG
ncbi:hypothetical protein CSOJ01_11590 [Colletotrichum sojae]|uniref:Uncharacterized protein n=1 Tax=Colletotrichum sojae TaxID=2175907 RepID=A0A8H6IXR5_9PEZI|nr:hypothetical protein CSOJ01_11590 [Colletotrichum sojae]